MSDWTNKQLGAVASTFAGGTPNRSVQDFFGGNIPWVKSTEVNRPFVDSTEERITEKGLRASSAKWAPKGASLVAMYGATAGQISCLKIKATTNQAVLAVVANDGLFNDYLFHYLVNSGDRLIYLAQGSGQPNLSKSIVDSLTVSFPSYGAQRKIAKILSTVDNLIEKTQALIDKYQSIKQGMMHDLFTRGIDENGQLRPSYEETPHLYKESELGWIPKEWEVYSLDSIAESLIDGPFGSNLKTEHYVDEAGIRVVRLQNVGVARYDDTERAYVSESHAKKLARHEVVPGDVLIGGMGEEKHPVGRACLYPDDLAPAINKADCFRLRCTKDQLLNAYASICLNTNRAKTQIYRYSQGVTRVRINTGNLRKVLFACPDVAEQLFVVQRLHSIEHLISIQDSLLVKLSKQKSGLMQDLLTGKVRVKVDA